jgi:hypothetical protein
LPSPRGGIFGRRAPPQRRPRCDRGSGRRSLAHARDVAKPTLYLYEPHLVSGQLSRLGHLAAVVSDPQREGVASAAFPGARRSPRQLYRVFATDHYHHLRRLLEMANEVVGAGFCPGQLTTTRHPLRFSSAVSELLVASQLVQSGFELRPPRAGSAVGPEFVATKAGTGWQSRSLRRAAGTA